MKLAVCWLLILGLCLSFLFGCIQKTKEIKIGYIPIAECLPLYVAIEKGYFKEAGLEVRLVQFSGGALILEALRAGSIDVGFSNLVSLVMAKAAGSDFVAIYGTTIEDKEHIIHGLVVEKDSNIKNLNDLEGKTIALNTFKNIDELLIKRYLEKHAVDVKKVRLVEIPFPRMSTVLLNNYVDTIAVVEPFLTMATLQGTNKVVGYYFIDTYPEVEITSYCVDRKWIAQNKETLRKLKIVMKKSVDSITTNEIEARKTLMTYTKIEPAVANKVSLPKFSNDVPSIEFLKWLIAEMQKQKFMQQEIDPSLLIYKE